jgi:hypothetical protein
VSEVESTVDEHILVLHSETSLYVLNLLYPKVYVSQTKIAAILQDDLKSWESWPLYWIWEIDFERKLDDEVKMAYKGEFECQALLFLPPYLEAMRPPVYFK